MIDGPVDLLDTGKMAVLADMDQVTPEGELPASGNQAFFQTCLLYTSDAADE